MKQTRTHLTTTIEKQPVKKHPQPKAVVHPTSAFTRELAKEIVRNLTAFGKITSRPFHRDQTIEKKELKAPEGEYPMLVDTSILIDGRILPIVNSGFFAATLLVPQFVLGEVQHIADSQDAIRRGKGRRGLDVVNTLKNQKVNPGVHLVVIGDDVTEVPEVDHKLIALIKQWGKTGKQVRLLTVDFNLAQVARAEGVKVLNINDLTQALKVALIPGEELTVKITHEGKEREQGVGYLSDGTMVVVEQTKDRVGQDVMVIITKVHQTPAGQLFFGRLK